VDLEAGAEDARIDEAARAWPLVVGGYKDVEDDGPVEELGRGVRVFVNLISNTRGSPLKKADEAGVTVNAIPPS
jgi:hypothetical protein